MDTTIVSTSPHSQLTDPLSAEVIAFCELVARIMYRCLTERNPRIMTLLNLPAVQEGEVQDEQAA